ncbi:hypothetical protein Hanom_Chr03g00252861 [Helianthus anomalus]
MRLLIIYSYMDHSKKIFTQTTGLEVIRKSMRWSKINRRGLIKS